ncbi:MAG: CHAT domain-containing tetratricopeptide repeat protein [Planctomycetota bacterium]
MPDSVPGPTAAAPCALPKRLLLAGAIAAFCSVGMGTVGLLPCRADEPDPAQQFRAALARVTELQNAGALEEAIEAAKHVIALDEKRDPPAPWWKRQAYRQRLTFLEKLHSLPEEARAELIRVSKLTADWRVANRKGRYDDATKVMREQYAVRKRWLGARHAGTATSLQLLANSLQQLGHLSEAEVLGRRAVELQAETLGLRHPATLASRQNLALLLHDRGESELAVREFGEVVALAETSLGPTHAVTLVATNNAALVSFETDDLDGARALLDRNLPRCREQGGERSLYTMTAIDQLAQVDQALGAFDMAEERFRGNLAMSVEVHGVDHPYTSNRRHHLARCLRDRGEFEAALAIADDAYERRTRILGRWHPETIGSGRLRGELLMALDRNAEAETLLAQVAEDYQSTRTLVTHRDLESSHFDAEHDPLPLLAACRMRLGKAAAALAALESSHARGLRDAVDRRRSRPLTPTERKEVLAALAEVRRLEEELVELRLAAKDVETENAETVAKTRALEVDYWAARARASALEARLSARYDRVGRAERSLAEVAAALPTRTALITWLTLPPIGPRAGANWALVLLGDGSVRGVPVAPSDPALIEELRELLSRERGSQTRGVGLRRRDPKVKLQDAKRWGELSTEAQRRWLAPVEAVLAEANARSWVVVPSGPLARIPLDTLTEPDELLYAPSGQVFAELRGRTPSRATELLAIGAPVAAAETPIGSSVREALGPLPFSQWEVTSVVKSIDREKSEVLTGASANEIRLAGLAQNDGLARFRYVHLATHAVIDPIDPLQSALLLSPRPVSDAAARIAAGEPVFDGWLTAEEIRRGWSLDAELVTLSACRTAVGSGAGYLSFAEALLVAGARRLVLSQWKVDDRASALLMSEFYRQLQGGEPPARALREAKRWLRSLTAAEVARRTSEVTKPGAVNPESRPFDHPYYWAAFVLIGSQ